MICAGMTGEYVAIAADETLLTGGLDGVQWGGPDALTNHCSVRVKDDGFFAAPAVG